MKKRKIGIFLILIGIAIPSVMFFFAEHELLLFRSDKTVSRWLTSDEIDKIQTIWQEKDIAKNTSEFAKFAIEYFLLPELTGRKQGITENWTVENNIIMYIPYRIFLGIGVLLGFIGIGFITFSFFPKTKN